MYGPKPLGHWSSHQAPNTSKEHEFLIAGKRYRVIRQFSDYDKAAHLVGEEWTFLGCSFVPYDDGMSFFVSPDGAGEWHIRLQWRPEEQGDILDHLANYLAEIPPPP